MTDTITFLGEELLALRQRCLDDVFFFGSEILGYDYLATPAEFHRAAARALLDETDFMLIAPRGHIKTTLVDVVGTIHHLLRHPDDRVLIAASTWDNARLVLREIVSHYRGNEVFRRLFPEVCPQNKDEEGNTEEYTIPVRGRPTKEASIETTGQDRVITGRHYDVIRCTDLVVRENVPPTAQPEQMKRTIEWFRTTTPLLDMTNPRAHRTVDGTFWNDQDLYCEIKKGYPNFRVLQVGIKDDDKGDPIPVWPELVRGGIQVLGTEKLRKIRSETGSYLWAANYRSDPQPLGALSFRREWFKTYHEAPRDLVETMNLRVAITVDLAISDKPGADRTAIVVTGISPARDFVVLSAQAGPFTPYDTLERLFLLNAEYQPVYVGIESVAWQKAMIFISNRESFNRGITLPVRALLPDARKERRAWPLMVHAENSGIWVRPEHTELVDELLRFPVGNHDDFVDALAYRGQDLMAPVIEALVQPKKLTHAPSSSTMTGDQLLQAAKRQAQAEEEELPWDLEEVF